MMTILCVFFTGVCFASCVTPYSWSHTEAGCDGVGRVLHYGAEPCGPREVRVCYSADYDTLTVGAREGWSMTCHIDRRALRNGQDIFKVQVTGPGISDGLKGTLGVRMTDSLKGVLDYNPLVGSFCVTKDFALAKIDSPAAVSYFMEAPYMRVFRFLGVNRFYRKEKVFAYIAFSCNDFVRVTAGIGSKDDWCSMESVDCEEWDFFEATQMLKKGAEIVDPDVARLRFEKSAEWLRLLQFSLNKFRDIQDGREAATLALRFIKAKKDKESQSLPLADRKDRLENIDECKYFASECEKVAAT